MQAIRQGQNPDNHEAYSFVDRDVNSAKAMFYVAWHLQNFDRHPFKPPLKGALIQKNRMNSAASL